MLETLRQRLKLPNPSSGPEPRPRYWLYPFEIYGLLATGGIVVFILGSGLRLGVESMQYTFIPMLRRAPEFLALGVALQVAYHLLTRQSVRAYFATVLSAGWLTLWGRIFAVTMLWNYAYFWLKVYVPLLHQELFDRQMWALDSAVHFGVSPSVFMVEALRGSWAVRGIDVWYGWWVMSIQGAVCFFAADPRAAVRRGFTLACTAMWTAGAALYCCLPALGPVYAVPGVWEGVRELLPSATATQEGLMANYVKLIALRETGVWVPFNPTRGIAAMPSLHVAGHCLLALWARRFARPLWALFVGATLLTFVGSIVTGWHYAIDGYVGAALAGAATWLAGRLELQGWSKRTAPEHTDGGAARSG